MKYIFSVLGYFFIYTSSAQLPVFVQERFNDNTHEWWIGENEHYSMNMERGKYIIQTTQKNVGRYSVITPDFDEHKNFVLEATFIQKSGSINHGFGLVFGDVSGGKHHEFIVASSGNFKIRSTVPGENINQWIATAINPLHSENVLRIEATDSVWHYSINGENVKTTQALTIHGSQVGIIAYTEMVLEVDDFNLHQDFGINLPPNLEFGYVKENLGHNVNSVYDDVGPHIAADGRTILFGVKNSPDNIGGVTDEEDVWITSSTDGTTWSKSVNLGTEINHEGTNNLLSISSDNNTLLFGNSMGFQIRKRIKNGWSVPEQLNLNFINEAGTMEGNLSADGKAILFTAKFKKNLHYKVEGKEKDIYVSVQTKEGVWSDPINLGDQVNTPDDEVSPFLAADGRTLYFASKGHPGYGSYDIYMSKRLGNNWTSWSEPVNLGPEINGPGFDAYFTMAASADYAYLVSNKNSLGKSDLVRLKLPEAIKPKPVVLLTGRTLDARTKNPMAASILIEDQVTQQRLSSGISDPTTGSFRMVFDNGQFIIHALAKGYISVNEKLELTGIRTYSELQKDLLLIPIEENESIELSNVFFQQGKAILKSESFPELDRLVEIMQDNPTMKIELGGHTDNSGNLEALMKLSIDRVQEVKTYMVKKGIRKDRIMGKGFGPTRPLVANDTNENKERNRRVEFKILKR
ncbi:MAG: putative outer membrane protein [Bacteroidota bacterium]|jgi:outer membrane protein OmpA-like peptidoglycan-associated protein